MTAPDTRVLRRFVRRDSYGAITEPLLGLYLDVEATSLDVERAKIIEFAAVKFQFNQAGQVGEIVADWSGFEDPGEPIPEDVSELTGITDFDVRGRRIEEAVVRSLVENVSLVVAHHASYDRPIAERRFPCFASLPWGCSYKDLDWQAFGCECSKLGHILTLVCGEFPSTTHRALDDCYAGVHALATAEHEGRSALSHLLESARRTMVRVWAIGSPFDCKDVLKARSYEWSSGEDRRPKAWWKDVPRDAYEDECYWLRQNAGVSQPKSNLITARNRYSRRIGS